MTRDREREALTYPRKRKKGNLICQNAESLAELPPPESIP